MRIISTLLVALLAVLLMGCGSGSTDTHTSTTGKDQAKPAAQAAAVTGAWTLDVENVKFVPNAEAQKELDKQPAGGAAVTALETQLKDQLKEKLGDAVWTFNADKTMTIKTKEKTTPGTWSQAGSEVTIKTDDAPEAKMTLSEDGKSLTATQVGEQGSITMALKKS